MRSMVKFECDHCGKCCRSFGEFIKIERQLTSRDYYCRYGIKNELFLAHIEPDYADSQPPSLKEGERVKGCPFMRENQNGKGIACAIYATRPGICRDFRCYRMVIRHRDGYECGRIMGRNELKTTDESLKQIWKERISPQLPSHDDPRWEKAVIDALAFRGYFGERVE
jgi:Fe-S-cluster containining protein